MKRLQILALGLFALAFGLVSGGCGTSESHVTVKLTDAPGDFKKAVVTISEVYLQGEGGKVVLSDKATTTNLLTLANDTADLVKDAVVPAGTYSELRFVVSGAYVEVEQADGSSLIYATDTHYEGLPEGAQVAGKLQAPSLGSSGLKVDFTGDVEITGEQKVILVDFNVAQSFGHEAGQGDKWVMHPVIKGADITFSGSVQVTLAKDPSVTMPTVNGQPLTLGDFKAVLTDAAGTHEELALTDSNGDGVFEGQFKFLVPGDYQVSFSAPAGVSFTINPAVPAPVTIASGKDVSQAFTLKSASYTTPMQ
ncbi:MAG: DUF4382 domain-containing protein [Archangium sp.]